jgi:hypothetical protein
MFQYATLLSIANRKGAKCTAPLSGTQIFECFDLKGCNNGLGESLTYLYREADFSYSDSINSLERDHNTDLIGYFQSDKYFSDYDALLREEFFFRPEVVESADKMGLDPENKVAIHVRMGDYLSLQDTHPTLDKLYYRSAMERFLADDFLVFSDDINWCRTSDMFFGEEKNGYYFSEGNAYEDLYLMSKCKGHIIANSSFSWWGSWLSERSEKTVAPKKWFGPKGPSNWQDVYREGWEVI